MKRFAITKSNGESDAGCEALELGAIYFYGL